MTKTEAMLKKISYIAVLCLPAYTLGIFNTLKLSNMTNFKVDYEIIYKKTYQSYTTKVCQPDKGILISSPSTGKKTSDWRKEIKIYQCLIDNIKYTVKDNRGRSKSGVYSIDQKKASSVDVTFGYSKEYENERFAGMYAREGAGQHEVKAREATLEDFAISHIFK